MSTVQEQPPSESPPTITGGADNTVDTKLPATATPGEAPTTETVHEQIPKPAADPNESRTPEPVDSGGVDLPANLPEPPPAQSRYRRERAPPWRNKHRCPNCPGRRFFRSPTALKRHLESNKCSENKDNSPIADAEAKGPKNSTPDQTPEDPLEVQKRTCPQCPKRGPFRTIRGLRAHTNSGCHDRMRMRELERAERKSKGEVEVKKCPCCPRYRKPFRTAAALKKHLNLKHPGWESDEDEDAAVTGTEAAAPVVEPSRQSEGDNQPPPGPENSTPIPASRGEPPIGAPPQTTQTPQTAQPPTPPSLHSGESPSVEQIIKIISAEIADTPHVTPAEMLKTINTTISRTQVLILSPTRRMALRVQRRLFSRCRPLGINICTCIGGSSLGRDIYNLRKGPQIVSGTVGRILQTAQRGWLPMEGEGLLVLNKGMQTLEEAWGEEIAELYLILGEGIRFAKASTRVPASGVPAGDGAVRDGVSAGDGTVRDGVPAGDGTVRDGVPAGDGTVRGGVSAGDGAVGGGVKV